MYAELMQFLERLDERHEAKLRKDNVLMARKVRQLGEVAHRPQPTNAPKWTIKQTAAPGQNPVLNYSVIVCKSLI